MSSITELWKNSRKAFDSKSLSQILSFAGDGRLKDGNSTSVEFRELLFQVPSEVVKQFIDSCLLDRFEDSGYALQDIVNQIGSRLGFKIEEGLYRGRQNEIGFDGIWTSQEGHKIIVEVKTTDAYRINLDIVANYRSKLMDKGKLKKDKSSILIIVGREDTGDLEAQIRGSIHAWDIRLISADSLLQLLSLKETLNDTKTLQQINELLKPREYTRVDTLIDLIFTTSRDLRLDDITESIDFVEPMKLAPRGNGSKAVYMSFHEDCLQKIQKKLRTTFVKQSRISYSNKEKTIGIICSVSKAHKQGKYNKYWFAFHPHQLEFLKEYPKAFVAYGCGSSDNTFLIPLKEFEPLLSNFWTTEKDDTMYWHVIIHERDGFSLQQPKNHQMPMIDLSKFRITS